MAKGNSQKNANGSALDFEAQLWAAAERAVPASQMEMTEYNGARPEGLCLGLIFLKYISDAFEEKREQPRKSEVRLKKEDGLTLLLSSFYLQTSPVSEWFIKDEPQRAETAVNYSRSAAIPFSASDGEKVAQPDEVFCQSRLRCRIPQLPPEARWHKIKSKAKSPEIGKVIDEAMGAIERESDVAQASSPAGSGGVPAASRNTGRGRPANPQPGTAALRSDSFRQDLHPDLKADFVPVWQDLANPPLNMSDWGGENLRQDVRCFSLSASIGERVGVRCRNPRLNRRGIHSVRGQRWPCASTSGGMFVSSEKFVEEHGGRVGDIAVYGQESNYTTWKLARMNLAIRGIDANLPHNA